MKLLGGLPSFEESGLYFYGISKEATTQWSSEFLDLKNFYLSLCKDWHKLRREEFLKGRFLIHSSLKKDGHYFWNLPIGLGERREPLLDSRFSAALTHNKNSIIFAYALGQVSVGIDIEEKARAKDEIERQVLTDKDKLLLDIISERQELITLVFSAKESCYKALYPFVKEYFGMKDAYLRHINLEEQSFEIVVTKKFKKAVSGEELILKGRYLSGPQNILTYILPDRDLGLLLGND